LLVLVDYKGLEFILVDENNAGVLDYYANFKLKVLRFDNVSV
jgi:hypothetical protein